MYKSLDNSKPSSLIKEIKEAEYNGATQKKHEEV
jgi:hypothetical protein